MREPGIQADCQRFVGCGMLRLGACIASNAVLGSLCGVMEAEIMNNNVRFTAVHMALVRTLMIRPINL